MKDLPWYHHIADVTVVCSTSTLIPQAPFTCNCGRLNPISKELYAGAGLMTSLPSPLLPSPRTVLMLPLRLNPSPSTMLSISTSSSWSRSGSILPIEVRTFDPIVLVGPGPLRGRVCPKLRRFLRCWVLVYGEPLMLSPAAPELLDLVVNAAIPVPSEWETVSAPLSRRSRICERWYQ
jgi:hypothetical protein